MRRFDKKTNIIKANLLTEQRYLDENRFSSSARKYEELLRNPLINNFVTSFQKLRDKELANVDLEVRPAFSDVRVTFIDKMQIKTSMGRDPKQDYDPNVL
jgi:hypothetical protein